MSNRSYLWGGALVLLCICGAGWLLFQRVYLPSVTRPSTVSAAEAGDLQLLRSLQQQGLSLDYHDPRKFMWTPLIAAVYADQSNVVEYLLRQNVDIDAQDASGKTALMWSVNAASNDLSVVEMLVASGAETEVADSNGSTVFDFAKGHPDSERLLNILSREHLAK